MCVWRCASWWWCPCVRSSETLCQATAYVCQLHRRKNRGSVCDVCVCACTYVHVWNANVCIIYAGTFLWSVCCVFCGGGGRGERCFCVCYYFCALCVFNWGGRGALYMLIHFYEVCCLVCFFLFLFFFLVDMLCVGLLLSLGLGYVFFFFWGGGVTWEIIADVDEASVCV